MKRLVQLAHDVPKILISPAALSVANELSGKKSDEPLKQMETKIILGNAKMLPFFFFHIIEDPVLLKFV